MKGLMYKGRILVTAVSFMLGAGCAADRQHSGGTWEQSRIIDLTHSFASDTIVWPTEQDFKLVVQHAEDTAGGYYYASNRMEMPEHGGTHIDAPIHFSKGKQTLDQIPIDRMVGAAIRIDVTEPVVAIGITRLSYQTSKLGKRSMVGSRIASSYC